jgi:hypothetical protein
MDPTSRPTAETPGHEAPAGTPGHEALAGTPGQETPVETPGRETLAGTPGQETPAGTPGRETPAGTSGREVAILAGAYGGSSLAMDRFNESAHESRFMQLIRAPSYEGSDPDVEATQYTLALLSEHERERILKESKLTPKDIEALLRNNSPARMFNTQVYLIEGDLVKEIDVRIDAPVFITDGTRVHTRESLMTTYPFEAMGVTPEEVFAQQELGVFPSRLDPAVSEYMVRDLGDTATFQVPEDQLRSTNSRMVKKAVKTKVFLARDGWTDFITTVRQLRAMMRFGKSATQRANDTGRANLFALNARALAGAAEPLAIESSAGRDERLERLEEELVRSEKRAQRLEARTDELLDILRGLDIGGLDGN